MSPVSGTGLPEQATFTTEKRGFFMNRISVRLAVTITMEWYG